MAVKQKEEQAPNIGELLRADLERLKNKLGSLKKTKKNPTTKSGTNDRTLLWAKIGFGLSLVGILGWLYPVIGVPLLIAAIVFNILGLKLEKKRWMAVAGLTLAIVFLNIAMLYTFYYYLMTMLYSGF